MKPEKAVRHSGGERIESLQALRALAFLGIFLLHAYFYFDWSMLGVSVFFVMSGFLMTYRYEQMGFESSVRNNLRFSLKKIGGLYPLHIITMLFIAALSVKDIAAGGPNSALIGDLVKKVLLHVTLLQSWVPNSTINVSLNGVAWYLSVALFLYFMFPWIKGMIDRCTTARLCVACFVILVLEIASCIPFIRHLGADSPVYIWFMYCFPVFRLGDFFIGCVLKRVYFESNIRNAGTVRVTIYELLATVATVLLFIWYKQAHTNIIAQAMQNWTTVFVPFAALWVFLFAAKRGLITRVLSNRVFIFLGNISAYAFLIHYVVIQYAIRFCLPELNLAPTFLNISLVVIAELAVTVVLSVAYRFIHGKCRGLFSRRKQPEQDTLLQSK